MRKVHRQKRFLCQWRKMWYHLTVGVTGSPILAGLPGYLECQVVECVDRGDHPLFVAEVVEAGVQNSLLPLALRDAGWSYGG